MQAYVYKSQRKADTYVYLAARDDFARLPPALADQVGALRFVLEVALTPERRLAREDAAVVRQNLAERGFHVQFPPDGVFAATLPHSPAGKPAVEGDDRDE